MYKEEESIKKLIEASKVKAPENLKYRIMNQIESEKTITPQHTPIKSTPNRESGSVLRDLGSIFGTMYSVLAVMILGAYLMQGKDFLLSPQFMGALIYVASIFSLFWLISRVDANIKERKSKRLASDRKNETRTNSSD